MKTISVQSKGKYFVYVQELENGKYLLRVSDIEAKETSGEIYNTEKEALEAAKKYTEEM